MQGQVACTHHDCLLQEAAPTGDAIDGPPTPALAIFRRILPVIEVELVFPGFPLAVPDMMELPSKL